MGLRGIAARGVGKAPAPAQRSRGIGKRERSLGKRYRRQRAEGTSVPEEARRFGFPRAKHCRGLCGGRGNVPPLFGLPVRRSRGARLPLRYGWAGRRRRAVFEGG